MKLVDIYSQLLIAVTQVKDGDIDERFSPPKLVKHNRQRIFKELDLGIEHLIEAQQVHGKLILPLAEENAKMWRGVSVTGIDGFVTDERGISLMIRVADCVPLILYDTSRPAFALLHVGWQGAYNRYHQLGLDYMAKFYKSEPRNLQAWIGPSAKAQSYTVSEPPKQLQDPDWKPFINKKGKLWHIDIPGFITESLHKAGVFKKHITIDPTDTVTDADYFSHTRSKQTGEPEGRFAVIAALR